MGDEGAEGAKCAEGHGDCCRQGNDLVIPKGNVSKR